MAWDSGWGSSGGGTTRRVGKLPSGYHYADDAPGGLNVPGRGGGHGFGAGIFGQAGHLIGGAVPGLAHFAGTAAHEFSPKSLLYDISGHHLARSEGDQTGEERFPLSRGFQHSYGRTGKRLIQTAQAAAPGGVPFGENPYSQAFRSREGGLGAVLEDVANVGLVGEAATGLLKSGASAATRGAAEATKAASAVDLEAARAAEADAARAAAAGDPAASARLSRARAAREALEEEAAGHTGRAAHLGERAARLSKLAEHTHIASNLFNKAAASPFAPVDFGLRRVVGPIIRAGAEAAGRTETGARFAGLMREHVTEPLNRMEQNRGRSRAMKQYLEEHGMGEQRIGTPEVRAMKVAREGLEGDPVLEQAQQLYQQRVPHANLELARLGPDMRAQAERILVERTGVEPEAMRLAFDAALGDTAEGQALRGRFEETSSTIRQGVVKPAEERFLGNVGEPRLEGDAAAQRQAYEEWSAHGTEQRVPAGAGGKLSGYESRLNRLDALLERQGGRVERARGALVREGERQPGLPRDPQALIETAYKPVTEVARRIVEEPAVWQELAADETLGPIVRLLQAGKIDRNAGQSRIADVLMRALDRPTTGAAATIVEAIRNQTPDLGAAERRAVPRLGTLAGVERTARAGERVAQAHETIDWMSRLWGKAADQLDAAERRMAETMAADPRIQGAVNAVERTSTRLANLRQQLAERAAQEGALSPFDVAGRTERQLAGEVLQLRQDVKRLLNEQADAMDAELLNADAGPIAPPPRIRRGGKYVRKGEGAYEGWENVPASVRGDSRYVRPDGMTPEQAIENWKQFRASGRGKSHMGAAQEGGQEVTLADWIDHVERARSARRAARVDAKQGWGREIAGTEAGTLLGGVKGRRREPPPIPTDMVAEVLGTDVVHAERYLTGDVNESARAVVSDVAAEVREGRTMRGEYAGDVGQALERGSATGLDRPGRAMFRTEATREAVGGAGEKVAGAKERVVGVAEEGQARARARGQREGAVVGRAEAAQRIADQQLEQAAARGERAAPVAEQATQSQVEALAKTAGTVGRPYFKAGESAQRLREAARKVGVEERVLRGLSERRQRELTRAYEDLASNPARYRVALAAGREVRDGFNRIADELDAQFSKGGDPIARGMGKAVADPIRAAGAEALTTLKDLEDAGVNPDFLIGGKLAVQKEGARSPLYEGRLSGDTRQVLPTVRKTGAHVGRKNPLEREWTISGVSEKHMQRVRQQAVNETAFGVQDLFGTTPRKLFEGDFSAEELKAMSKEDILAEVHNRGFETWNPSSPFSPATVTHAATDLDTALLPTHLHKQFMGYGPLRAPTFWRVYDNITRYWKAGVLALTGRWHVGNIVGNTIMATVGAGLAPAEYARAAQISRHLLKQGHVIDEAYLATLSPKLRAGLSEGAFLPPELLHRGQVAAEFRQARLPIEEKLKARQLIAKSYRFNGFVDDWNRGAVFIAKLERGLDDRAYGDFIKQYPEFAELPREQVEKEAAIRLSLRALGDFTNMNALEKNVVRRIIPFYPWLRHITKLSANLAIHSPLRVAWTLHLANMFSDKELPLPWLEGAIHAGGNRYVRLPNVNPFGDVLKSVGITPEGFSPAAIGQNASPLIGAADALARGEDIRTGLPITRAPGSGNLDEFGRGAATPLLGRPKEALYYLGSQVPPVVAAREGLPAIFGGKPIQRYPTGQAYHLKGQPLAGDNLAGVPSGAGQLLGLLGLPRPEDIDTQAILDRADARRRQNAAARRSYLGQHTPRPASTSSGGGGGGWSSGWQ